MKKIEVGEYVRTDNGIMDKVLGYDETIDIYYCKYINIDHLNKIGCHLNKVKHSKNIIDLIEVGDYVNGDFVVQISKTFGYIFVKTTYYDELTGEEKYQFIKKEDIKTILTHEQYENNCYRLEE